MKNNEKLLYTIGEVKDKSVPDVPEKKPGTLWMKLSAAGCGVAAAALLGIVILGGGQGEQPPYGGGTSDVVTNYDPGQSTADNSETTETEPGTTTSPVDWAEITIYPEFSYQPEDKELVHFSANISNIKGAAAEGFGAYDNELEEMLSQNPWNESMKLETLPVYHNAVMDNWLSKTSYGGFCMYLSEEQMNAMAESAAYLLGTEIASRNTFYDAYLEGFDEAPTDEQLEAAPTMPYQLDAKCADGTEIQVDGAGQIWIRFDPSVQHPDGYGLDESETKQECMDYIMEKFSGLLQFKAPIAYSLNSNSMSVYDSAGNAVQKILNYSLYNARFFGDADGDLSQIYIDNAFISSRYIGDYPIITPDKAREMLLEGKFVANIWGGYIKNGAVSEEDIGGVELMYRYSGRHEENYQPYYCFYVELDREEEFYENFPGMTYYGAFYVPAVSEEYIGELTQWYALSKPAEDQNGNYGKDNYQDDPYEFIGGIEQIVKNSDTIEGMYQALNEFDTNGRIDKILISFDGVPVTVAEGELKKGMLFEVYYDNEASWFEFRL